MTESLALRFLVRKRTTFTWLVPLGLLAATYVWGKPSLRGFIAGCLLLILGEIVRFWAAGYIQKDNTIATTGPYALVRNPLYFGSLLLAVGYLAISGLGWIAWVVVLGFFMLFHLAAITYEEQFLIGKFGEPYAEYLKRVPRLVPFPRIGVAHNEPVSGGHFSMGQAIYNREHITAAVTVATAVVFAVLEFIRFGGLGH